GELGAALLVVAAADVVDGVVEEHRAEDVARLLPGEAREVARDVEDVLERVVRARRRGVGGDERALERVAHRKRSQRGDGVDHGSERMRWAAMRLTMGAAKPRG